MLNKVCQLCLLRVNEEKNQQKSLKEIKKLVEEIFRVELDLSLNTENEEYCVCLLCSEKLNLSSELYKTILESQQCLMEQKSQIVYVTATDDVNFETIEMKLELEEEGNGNVVPDTKTCTRKTRSVSENNKKEKKPVKSTPKQRNSVVSKEENGMDDQKVSEFYHFTCPECLNPFESFKKYKSHMIHQHSVRLPAVVCCNIRLTKRCHLLEHYIYHTDPAQFRCPECNKQCKSSHRLATHRKQWHSSKETLEHQCDKCPKRFLTVSHLKAHLHSHLTQEEKAALKTHICEDCNIGFKAKSLLAQHMRKIHLKMYSCVCDICARTFNSKNDFLYHYASTHQVNSMPKVQCHICQKFLLNERCLKAHIKRIHKEEGPHICKICGKVSPTVTALRSHQIYMHERERKFKCTHCEKAFKREVSLKEHLTTHVGGVLYNCQFCDKTFNSGANMYSHRKRAHPKEHERLMQEKLNEKRPNI